MRNVGFVKVDQGDDECIVHIHGKGLRLEGEKELTIYLFYGKGDECIGIPQGTIENVNPAVNYQLKFTNEDTGEPENYPIIEGIIMENRSHRKYAAVWNDMPVNVNDMRLWTSQDKRMNEVMPPAMMDVEDADGKAGNAEVGKEIAEDREAPLQTDIQAEKVVQKISQEEAADENDVEEVLEAQNERVLQKAVMEEVKPVRVEREERRENEMIRPAGENTNAGTNTNVNSNAGSNTNTGVNNNTGANNNTGINNNTSTNNNTGANNNNTGTNTGTSNNTGTNNNSGTNNNINTNTNSGKEPEAARKCTKIQRQEMVNLPRCEWKLSNNSFLLHGYYNYHHLVLIEENGHLWLGVPGIYHAKEAKAAEAFGFPQFIKADKLDVDLCDDEKNDKEEFGYWCRHIRI